MRNVLEKGPVLFVVKRPFKKHFFFAFHQNPSFSDDDGTRYGCEKSYFYRHSTNVWKKSPSNNLTKKAKDSEIVLWLN